MVASFWWKRHHDGACNSLQVHFGFSTKIEKPGIVMIILVEKPSLWIVEKHCLAWGDEGGKA